MKRRRNDEVLCLKVESEHAEMRRKTLFVDGQLEDVAVGLGVACERKITVQLPARQTTAGFRELTNNPNLLDVA